MFSPALLKRPAQCMMLTFAVAAMTSTAHAACQYTVTNQWGGGFTASVKVTNNTNAAVNSWNVSWQYSGDNRVAGGWNANITGNNPYSASNESWNGNLQPGQSAEFGFQGTKGGSTAAIPAVTGTPCN